MGIKKSTDLHHFRRGVTYVPVPRREPKAIATQVGQSLRGAPTFCDAWHARRLKVWCLKSAHNKVFRL